MILIILLLLLATEEASPRGSLCFSDAEQCHTWAGDDIEVPPEDAVRRYVWMSEDHRTLIVGELPAGGTSIDLDAAGKSAREMTLVVRGHSNRGWPADIRFRLAESKDKSWSWTIPAQSTEREIRIYSPAGEHRLMLTAPRHRTEGRTLRAEKKLALGTIELRPLSAVSGKVTQTVEERVTAVHGAQLFLADGTAAATTDEQGQFRFELSEFGTKEIVVAAPGLGSRAIPLERLEAENDLGVIHLERGVTLTLLVDRDDDIGNAKLGIRLLRKHPDRHEPSVVARAELAAGEDKTSFADLAPGEYRLLIEGADVLQRMAVPLAIETIDLEETIAIRPFELRGNVRFGEEALREGEVEISPLGLGPTWRSRLEIDSEGQFGGVLWQTGRFSGFVFSTETGGGILHADSPELGADPSEWTLSFKKRSIHGRILDSQTGAPAKDVDFGLKTTTQSGRGHSSVKVTPEGQYEISAWEDGLYDLIVTAPDYLPVTKTIELSDADGTRKLDIPLDSGSNVTMEFFWASGARIVSPHIFEGVARDGYNPERIHRTDASGKLTLSVRGETPRVLYVAPQEGSFAVVRVSPNRSSNDRPLRVEVPEPAGSLRLTMKHVQEASIPGIVMMRYNGEWLPYPLSGRFRSDAGGVAQFLRLPAGAYELWAIPTPSKGESLVNAPPPHHPTWVGVTGGETIAELLVRSEYVGRGAR
jgi:hypothetical protein